MAKEKRVPATAWQKGQSSPNPAGRPRKTGKPVSKLRSTAAKLRELEPQALENIQKSVEGQQVDKEVLASSKWVVTTMVSVMKSALDEELAVQKIRKENQELADEVEDEQSEEPQVKFSLNMLPTPQDLQ